MIEPISSVNITDAGSAGERITNSSAAATNVQEEFLVLFYKELLTNTLKMPNLNGNNDEEKDAASSFSTSFTSDLMAEKLATELAKKQLAQRKLISNDDN